MLLFEWGGCQRKARITPAMRANNPQGGLSDGRPVGCPVCDVLLSFDFGSLRLCAWAEKRQVFAMLGWDGGPRLGYNKANFGGSS